MTATQNQTGVKITGVKNWNWVDFHAMQAFESRQLRVTCFGAKLFSSYCVKKSLFIISITMVPSTDFIYLFSLLSRTGKCSHSQMFFISILTNATEGISTEYYNKSVSEDKEHANI